MTVHNLTFFKKDYYEDTRLFCWQVRCTEKYEEIVIFCATFCFSPCYYRNHLQQKKNKNKLWGSRPVPCATHPLSLLDKLYWRRYFPIPWVPVWKLKVPGGSGRKRPVSINYGAAGAVLAPWLTARTRRDAAALGARGGGGGVPRGCVSLKTRWKQLEELEWSTLLFKRRLFLLFLKEFY